MGNGDRLTTPKVLGHAEVTVVAGHGAQKLDRLVLVGGGIGRPGFRPACSATPEGAHDIVLDQQARRTQHERLLGRATQKFASKLTRRRNALETTVVAAVHATIMQIGIGAQDIEHGARDVHLRRRGLAAGHVERQATSLDSGNLVFERGNRLCKLT